MTLQQQVNTFDQGKRLKELGVTQHGQFSWFGDERPRLMDNGKDGAVYGPWLWIGRTLPQNNQEADWRNNVCCTMPIAPAFTVAELGDMLPDRFYTMRVTDKHDVAKGQWHCISQRIGEVRCYGATEAEARAAMLIHLIETKVITAAEVNERINKAA